MQVDDANWDPTELKALHLVLDGDCSSLSPRTLTRSGANLITSLTPLEVVQCSDTSRYGSYLSYRLTMTLPDDVSHEIRYPWYFSNVLKSPTTPDSTCDFTISARTASGAMALENGAYQIDS